MKYLIISDIHGASAPVKKALFYFNELHCDKLIILGDILYHGPRNPIPSDYNPQEVVALLNSLKEQIIAVRGNCEAEVDQMLLQFPCMSDYGMIVDNDRTIFATHGHLFNPTQLPALPKDSLFLYGHTHLWELEKRVDFTVCNPGSITLPKENRPATFAVYEDGVLSVRTLEENLILQSIDLKSK